MTGIQGLPAARFRDPTSHGGTITFGATNVFINRSLAARKGDPHVCPMSDGLKPHVGGVITGSSETVMIGNAYAARVGDLCGCSTAGVSGQGVPAVAGPGATGEDDVGLHGEALDTDGDGTKDTLRADLKSMEGIHEKGALIEGYDPILGPVEIGYSFDADGPYGHAEGGVHGDLGYGGGSDFEGGAGRADGEVYFGPAGDDGRNPYFALGAEGDLVHGQAGSDMLVGYDGRRVGLGGGIGASGELVGAKVTGRAGTPSVFGWTIQCRSEVGGTLDGVGAGGSWFLYYDTVEERWHLRSTLFGSIAAGLGLGMDLSIGKAYQAEGTPGEGAGGIPNYIAAGAANVFIG